ncbi:ABC transporter ATP-binding protein [Lactococcus carnosus]|uniref:ABC transporter ATP-binding protein n=1 Tax=Pseudolactococcus carnosus TaxID=2749961 RepID=UPI000811DF95|nr:ABC transporter ATP-binding protein [Lactococcus carnosus]SCA92779.1 putative Bacitracin/lantibiotic transporter ATP-binding protein [Lactococcus piscium]MCJ1970191.1 ABC transporter ATP-binding protein [Lactococcus carnosus]MCJ1973868.1 ABC transporter ATP-binding protein [Lactococcus carnosus]MCJ1974869.1 ABC transporter ATP-binding protein [Lactococcus carnosus]MCJ1979543.1 ABC transporter ATP-binding protein [Lactococcus carnosus]
MNILTISNLNFSYGKKRIINNGNLSVESGDIVGLIGNNGSGKTTLMKLISGIIPGYSENITVNSKSIGILIEEPSLYKDMTVIENLRFYCKLYRKEYDVISKYKKILGVETFLNKKVSKLSLGMKQRIGLFSALIASNEFVLLDEPTNGLDPTGIDDLLKLIKKLSLDFDITFIISSHILENLDKICNKNVLIRDEKLIYLDSSEYMKFKIYSFEVSQNMIIKILEAKAISYESNKRDIIVSASDIEQVESLFNEKNIRISKEKSSLSEVYFNEK